MGKANKAAATVATAATAAPAQVLVGYVPGNYNPKANGATKHGNGGTAGTWAAVLAAHAAGGGVPQPLSYWRTVAAGNGDPGWAAWGANPKRKYLVPVYQPAA